jgi:hypothetical protein
MKTLNVSSKPHQVACAGRFVGAIFNRDCSRERRKCNPLPQILVRALLLIAVCIPADAFAADAPKSVIAPDQVPQKASLQDVEKRFTTRQRGAMFCIPCGIETALNYYGIKDYSQEKLVLQWVKSGGRLRGRSGFLNTNGASDEQIIAGARNATLWGANFKNFKQVAETVVPLNHLGYELGFGVMKSLEDYSRALKHAIANDWVFIMSVSAWGGAHIVTAVAYDGDTVTLWEPSGGKFHTRKLADFKPNLDLLILRPAPKSQ